MGKMSRMIAVVAVMTLAMASIAGAAGAATRSTGSTGASATVSDYVVLVADGASSADAVKAVRAAGGTVDATNAAVGVLKVSTSNPSFVNQVSAAKAIEGAARDKVIGRVPTSPRPAGEIERLDAERATLGGDVGRRGRGGPPLPPEAGQGRSADPAAVGHAGHRRPAGPRRADG